LSRNLGSYVRILRAPFAVISFFSIGCLALQAWAVDVENHLKQKSPAPRTEGRSSEPPLRTDLRTFVAPSESGATFRQFQQLLKGAAAHSETKLASSIPELMRKWPYFSCEGAALKSPHAEVSAILKTLLAKPDQLTEYRKMMTLEAGPRLQEAKQSGDIRLWDQLAHDFPFSQEAGTALSHLSARWMDLGEPFLASLYADKLLSEHPEILKEDPQKPKQHVPLISRLTALYQLAGRPLPENLAKAGSTLSLSPMAKDPRGDYSKASFFDDLLGVPDPEKDSSVTKKNEFYHRALRLLGPEAVLSHFPAEEGKEFSCDAFFLPFRGISLGNSEQRVLPRLRYLAALKKGAN